MIGDEAVLKPIGRKVGWNFFLKYALAVEEKSIQQKPGSLTFRDSLFFMSADLLHVCTPAEYLTRQNLFDSIRCSCFVVPPRSDGFNALRSRLINLFNVQKFEYSEFSEKINAPHPDIILYQ